MSDIAEPASTAAIVRAIRSKIDHGGYAAGQRLIEVDLAEEFGVGRGRIREVFRMLVGEGYLTSLENRGVYVRRFSRVEILEMGRVREVLEGLSARLAAEKSLTSAERDRLEGHQARLDAAEAAVEIDRYNEENFAYHETILQLGGNRHAAEFLNRVRLPLYRLQLPRTFSLDSLSTSNRDHKVITAAILSGNPEAAEAAMRSHVRAGNAHVARLAEHHFS